MIQTVTVSGGNLYQIALQQYGDATQWWRIAQANGLTDPNIIGIVTISIPSMTATDTGGILDPRR